MKILVSVSSFGEAGSQPMELLESAGVEVVLNPMGRKLTAEEVVQYARGCAGILAGVEPLTAEVIGQLPELRCISRCGVGLDNVDGRAAEARGIVVTSTPDAPTRAVAELALGLVLDLCRRISVSDRTIRLGQWTKQTGILLEGKQAGIVGLGRIGRALGEMLFNLSCRVAACEPYPDRAWLIRFNCPLLSLPELLRESDIVSLHLAYSPQTHHLIGKPELASMKEGAFLLNLSRGGAVDEVALYEALRSGHLGGAALDVFENEPYSGPLRELDNVVLTPHIGSYARESRLAMEVAAAHNLLNGLRRCGLG